MAAIPPQQFCVRWNSYHTNLQSWFPRVLLSEQFADVTLACESRQLRCHKLVLSACSAYLERLLAQNPCKHPIVLMRDMRFSEMQALVDFMYKGEVNVTQDELPSLLKSAEALQIRGLCSSEGGSLVSEGGSPELSPHASLPPQHGNTNTNVNGGSAPPSKPFSPPKKKENDVKEETVEEDGLYYGELDHDQMEYQEDEEPGKPSSSLGQTSDLSPCPDYAIANVQCQYDSPSDTEEERGEAVPAGGGSGCVTDHTYNTRDEPPAFIIHQRLPRTPVPQSLGQKIMTLAPDPGPGLPTLNVIHVGDQPPHMISPSPEYSISKRIRRSEVVLRQAADCVSRGLTFQTVSEQFNIPISTIRFFMARKGILPRRRRGRSTLARVSASPEPPFHMQHYKLPHMLALQGEGDEDSGSCH